MQPNQEFLFSFFIYSLRAIVLLFWGVIFLFYNKRSRQNFPLSVIFIIIGLLNLRNLFVRFPSLEAVDVYNPLSYFILIFIAPFTIFYLYFALKEERSSRQYLQYFLPFFLVLSLWGILQLLGEEPIPFCYSIKDLFRYGSDYPLHAGFFILLITVFVAQVLTYFSIALTKLLRLWKVYKENKVSLSPLKKLIAMDFIFLIYPLTCVFHMSFNNASHFGLGFNLLVVAAISIISVLNINLILPIKTQFDAIESNEEFSSPLQSATKEKTLVDKGLMVKIRVLFEEKELFRLSEITIKDLAEELNTNENCISTCINKFFGCSFEQLLLRYRVNAVKDLLCHTTFEVQEIINKTGFATPASFHKAFKEHICNELSPIEWRVHNTKNQKIAKQSSAQLSRI